jgi:hypothetical protein
MRGRLATAGRCPIPGHFVSTRRIGRGGVFNHHRGERPGSSTTDDTDGHGWEKDRSAQGNRGIWPQRITRNTRKFEQKRTKATKGKEGIYSTKHGRYSAAMELTVASAFALQLPPSLKRWRTSGTDGRAAGSGDLQAAASSISNPSLQDPTGQQKAEKYNQRHPNSDATINCHCP